MIFNDVDSARHLWRRSPHHIKQDKIYLSIWNIGKNMFKRNIESAYASLNYEWPEQIRPLILELRMTIRQMGISSIRKSYSKISITNACRILSYSMEELKNGILDNSYNK